jgi:uncharacterized protein YndB with AHSA1/START domain
MSDRAVTHSTFTVERSYPADVATVFNAWADPAKKNRWFAGGDAHHSLDFTVGGLEIAKGEHDGTHINFTATYVDIVPNERIACTSTMYFGDVLSTVSLTTVEFSGSGDKTEIVLTEHGAYLDGQEKPEWREHGTGEQLTALGELLST